MNHRLARGARAALSRALAAGLIVVLGLVSLPVDAVLGHSADPPIGGSGWAAGQSIGYMWTPGQVPPSWLQTAFNDAVGQSNRATGTRNPQFSLQSSASSRVAYGEPTGCSAAGIACFSRSAPYSFRIWYRAHGYWFDWGQLRWCQGPSGYVNGCFDADNIGLDELGHVQGLDHHVNWSNGSDYSDAVVQAVSRSRPSAGWNAHAFGRCDLARLQLLYDRFRTSDLFSTCLSIGSVTHMTASAGSALAGTSVLFTATLASAVSSSYGALSGDPVAGRTVYLERRFPGGSSWTSVAVMTAGANAGTYSVWASITGTYEWRAAFYRPATDGLASSSSAPVTVYLQRCTICPNRVAL